MAAASKLALRPPSIAMTVTPFSETSRLPALPVFIGLSLALLLALGVAPLVGPASLSLERLLDNSIPWDQNTDRVILVELRLPRMLFGAVAGMCLALAGAAFQALLRNDLATPYTLGVSGGASLGALAMMHLGIAFGAWINIAIPAAALLGAAVAVALILWLASRASGPDRVTTLLLAGVTMNLIFGAGILVIQFLANPFEAYGFIRWMMGGLDIDSMRLPLILLIPAIGGLAILWSQSRALNVLTLGDSTAAHLGFETERVRLLILGTASALTALIVAWAGPIGFVGLIIPHALRRVLGPDHRRLLPAVAIAGAAFLVACDTVARLIGGEVEFPVGIVTSALGGPAFLWILMRRRS